MIDQGTDSRARRWEKGQSGGREPFTAAAVLDASGHQRKHACVAITLQRLSTENFEDYERLTGRGDDGRSCYCSFWHLKVTSMAEYDERKARQPLALREIVRSRMNAGFHVGCLAYEGSELVAWISVGPM